MCENVVTIKFCNKHNCKKDYIESSKRFRCKQCKRDSDNKRNRTLTEEQRQIKYLKQSISQKKRRLINPEKFKKIEDKYRQSDKFRDNLIKKAKVKFSNLYCMKCNTTRVYNCDYCNDCNKMIEFANKHNYQSICKCCNNSFGLEVKISNIGKILQIDKYCSIECKNNFIQLNSKEYRKEYKKTKVYKDYNRERKRNYSYKKRVINSGNKYQWIIRRVLFERFNYICQGCNVKCVHPNDTNYNEDNCATIDHIKPVSKGGSHTYDNTQLLCRKCNWIKRDNENYFEHKKKAKQLELQLDFNVIQYENGKQLSFFGQEA